MMLTAMIATTDPSAIMPQGSAGLIGLTGLRPGRPGPLPVDLPPDLPVERGLVFDDMGAFRMIRAFRARPSQWYSYYGSRTSETRHLDSMAS